MKGVIWKIEGRKSIVLFGNGDFRAVPTPPDAQTGMTVTVSFNKKRLFLFAAALCAVVVAALLAAALYFSPAGYIDIIYEQPEDRRIIMEFSINRFDRILAPRFFSAETAFTESMPPLKYRDVAAGYADTLKAASLVRAATETPAVLIRIAHKDTEHAEKLQRRFTYLTRKLETTTGRSPALEFELERLK